MPPDPARSAGAPEDFWAITVCPTSNDPYTCGCDGECAERVVEVVPASLPSGSGDAGVRHIEEFGYPHNPEADEVEAGEDK